MKCRRCHERVAVKGRRLCRACAKRKLEERLAWIKRRLREKGCIDCLRPALKGKRRCRIHDARQRKYQREYDRKRRRVA